MIPSVDLARYVVGLFGFYKLSFKYYGYSEFYASFVFTELLWFSAASALTILCIFIDSAEGEDDEIDDSDDDRTIYSNYYLDHEYYEPESPPGARAEIQEGTEYEACSCFPNRTDKNKGSMLYDKIKCKHTGLIGKP